MTATLEGPVRGETDDRKSDRRLAFWLVSPAVLLMLAVTAYPIAYAVWLSLLRYNLAAPDDVEFIWLGKPGDGEPAFTHPIELVRIVLQPVPAHDGERVSSHLTFLP